MAASKQVKGWFDMPGRPGDRTFEQQLRGLDWLWDNCEGKTVLDAGCAEGLIGLRTIPHWSEHVHGVELVHERVQVAIKHAIPLAPKLNWEFEVGDMNTWAPKKQYDIVLGLAILHKLKDPSRVAARLANAARETVIFRLPPAGAPTIVDRRSGMVPHDIGAVLEGCGFRLAEATNDGPFGEWVGRWERKT
jgi:2-polyprenyl-3-methyl-5-hydroxy-6-metoxy-1,4-benzoquinol methylase